MTDYTALKVPELKKLLQDRGLAISGNKPDLIARLEESDSSTTKGQPATSDPAASKPAAPASVPSATNGSEVKQPPATSPSKSTEPPKADQKATATETSKVPPESSNTAEESTSKDDATKPTADDATTETAPAVDFSAGLAQTSLEQELERRKKRAAKFGITVDSAETEKALARAKKFGTGTGSDDASALAVRGLDQALPERTGRKRGRGAEGAGSGEVAGGGKRGRSEKGGGKKPYKGVLDDPTEKQKAEARAKKFGAKS